MPHCSECGDKRKTQKCKICDENICKKCIKEGIWIKDWLYVELKCDNCKAVCCSSCIKKCYSCSNYDTSSSLCIECSSYKKICYNHNWYICDKGGKNNDGTFHDKCGECSTKKKYNMGLSK